jgi:DNA-binding transcriptional MocR family regulator
MDGGQEEAASIEAVVDAIQVRTARGIAAGITAAIQRGELRSGTRLPTVRQVASALGVSPATVVNAWSLLRRRRVLTTSGRRGTFVTGLPSISRPNRFDRVGNFGRRLAVDLTQLVPDPSLLPDLRPAFAAALGVGISTGYGEDSITPHLRAVAEAEWPFRAAGWTTTNGGYDAMHLLAQTSFGPGDVVAVEEPTAARLLDIIESTGASPVPVACDGDGPLPDALAATLTSSPVAFVFQPRAQSPAGHALTAERAQLLAEALQPSGAIVIEDDGSPYLSGVEACSVGQYLPERTVLVRSLSKSHGPDLRVAVVGGPEEVIARVVALRTFGSRWTSRILQDAAAYLLTDADSLEVVAKARGVYGQRRAALAAALEERRVHTTNRDGLALWMPVHDERYALVTCAAHGIATSPGSRFCLLQRQDHLRVSPTQLVDGIDEIADVLALAAARPPTGS